MQKIYVPTLTYTVLLLAGVSILNVSCKRSVAPTSNLNYLLLGSQGLVAAANNSTVNICTTGQSSEDRVLDIQKTVESYFLAMDATPVVQVGSNNNSNCDATVNFTPGVNPAYTEVSAQPVVHVDPNSQTWYGTLGIYVHEFGHAFGLADTYDQATRQAGNCVSGQPREAAMCSPFYDAPQLDDVNGVREVAGLRSMDEGGYAALGSIGGSHAQAGRDNFSSSYDQRQRQNKNMDRFRDNSSKDVCSELFQGGARLASDRSGGLAVSATSRIRRMALCIGTKSQCLQVGHGNKTGNPFRPSPFEVSGQTQRIMMVESSRLGNSTNFVYETTSPVQFPLQGGDSFVQGMSEEYGLFLCAASIR